MSSTFNANGAGGETELLKTSFNNFALSPEPQC
jgi:hypothetical protein